MKNILIGVVSLLVVASCGGENEPDVTVINIESGKAIVEANCTGCHTLAGQGKTAKIPNLAGQPVDYLVEAMHEYRDGSRRHAALQELIGGFSESDIRNIAGFFAGLSPVAPAPVKESSESTYHEGAEVAAVCIECHGDRGISTTPGIPSLAGQQPVYLIVATQEYADGSRGHAEKEEMMRGLGDVDIEKMAMYFSSQTPELRDPPPFGDPAAGEPLTAICGSCHGDRGVSQDPMIPNLAGQEPTYLVNAITAYRDNERSHEDMVTDQTDEEIGNIAAFYSVQAAGSVTGTGEETTAVIAKCERCHGQPAGQSTMIVPALRGQKQEYLLRVMKQYRDGERGSSMMHKMSAGYSDELLEEISAYYASHP